MSRLLTALGVPVAQDDISLALWPTMDLQPPDLHTVSSHRSCEPDAFFTGPGIALAMEAKFKGSTIGHYLTQLGRQWLIAHAHGEKRGWRGPRLLVVTSDIREPSVPAVAGDATGLWAISGVQVSLEMQVAQFNDWTGQQLGRPLPGLDEVGGTVVWASWHRLMEVCSRLAKRAPQRRDRKHQAQGRFIQPLHSSPSGSPGRRHNRASPYACPV